MRPPDPPKCEHGFVNFSQCEDCHQRDKDIRQLVAPLVDEFWEERGKRDLAHLMYRAFRMGIAYQSGKS